MAGAGNGSKHLHCGDLQIYIRDRLGLVSGNLHLDTRIDNHDRYGLYPASWRTRPGRHNL